MRSKYLLLFISLVLGACSSGIKITSADNPVYSKGMPLVYDGTELPEPNSKLGVMRIMKGNSFVSTGAFISSEGLLVTNYSAAIDLITSDPNGISSIFENGFLAESEEQEVPLMGITLLVVIEQVDVTDIIQKDIVESELTNYQITQTIERNKTELIERRTGNDPNILVEINDIYSGNQQVMNVYRVIRDVRLVFSPPISIAENNTIDSRAIYKEIADKFVLLRAYVRNDESTSSGKTSYSPDYFFSFTEDQPAETDTLTALGAPAQTYRLESARAIDLYHNHTNSYTLGMLKILLDREEQRASQNPELRQTSLAGRVNLAQNVLLFDKITEVINRNDLIDKKKSDDLELISWIKRDTSRILKYNNIYYYLNEAYDLALQTADIFYASSYFLNISSLDDLAQPVRTFINDNNGPIDLNSLVANHRKILSSIDIENELEVFVKSLKLMQSMPENQKPLTLYLVFDSDSSKTIPDEILTDFRNSALFSSDSLASLITNGDPNSDLLFSILDEILFSQEMALQNFSRFSQYERPAQQIYTRLQLEADSIGTIQPDGNITLRYNKGSLIEVDSTIIKTSNDFSGRAQGSLILNSDGDIVGLVGDEINTSIYGNYYYTKEHSFVNAVRPSAFFDALKKYPNHQSLLNEIQSIQISQ